MDIPGPYHKNMRTKIGLFLILSSFVVQLSPRQDSVIRKTLVHTGFIFEYDPGLILSEC